MYQRFAYVYDALMDLDYYDYWYDLIERLNAVGEVVDFGCGTGTLLLALSSETRVLTGVDLSKEMIEVANMKAKNISVDASFIVSDMLTYTHQLPIDTALCLCDSINYLKTKEDVALFLKHVSLQLSHEGLFVLDFHTEYKRDHVFNDYHELQDEDDYYLKWDVTKTDPTHIQHRVQFKDKLDGFELDETHTQLILSLNEYKEMLEQNNLLIVEHLIDFKIPNKVKKGERHILVAKKIS